MTESERVDLTIAAFCEYFDERSVVGLMTTMTATSELRNGRGCGGGGGGESFSSGYSEPNEGGGQMAVRIGDGRGK